MSRLAPLALAISVLSLASPATAQVPLLATLGGPQGFGTDCLSTNDDGSSMAIPLAPAFPTGLQFFGATHTVMYVNTNGNISFRDTVSTYTPDPFPVASQPMIAPYWADVDIRGVACSGLGGDRGCANPTTNGVWWDLRPGQIVITWHDVGYYMCKDDLKMNFQLILTAAPSCGAAGDFDVEFRYNQCDWNVGDASGGVDGFCDGSRPTCTPGQAGFDAGDSTNFVEIMGSRTDTIHTTLCTSSNVAEPGIWRFQIRSGSVICPDAGAPCDTGLDGVCGQGATQCVGSGTTCSQVVTASPERCDGLDNDCNGMIDDGMALCGALDTCVRGVCVRNCFEGGCVAGQTCTIDNLCVDDGCESLTCPVNERCVAGACVGACNGIVCPGSLSCRAGRCIDACAGIACDDCTACDDGACIPRCSMDPCASGETCTAAGHCIPTACDGVICPTGQMCDATGSCVDACTGATCPTGETCQVGLCVPSMPGPDAGVDAGLDAGPDTGMPVDAGDVDSSICPVGFTCGPPPADKGGCCAVAGSSKPGSPLLLLVGVALLALVGRRRR